MVTSNLLLGPSQAGHSLKRLSFGRRPRGVLTRAKVGRPKSQGGVHIEVESSLGARVLYQEVGLDLSKGFFFLMQARSVLVRHRTSSK